MLMSYTCIISYAVFLKTVLWRNMLYAIKINIVIINKFDP